MSSKSGDKITKEIALFFVPLCAAYLFVTFYEAGFASVFGIPLDILTVNITHVILTNRYTLMVAVIAFLWIGLYYNILPSTNSPFFKGIITVILILSIALGITFGRSDAKTQTSYLVLNDVPEQVVVRIYNDLVVTAPFDRESKVLVQAFYIHKIGEDPNRVYLRQNIGPLKVVK